MALQDLRYQKNFKDKEQMLQHLKSFKVELKPCIGMWYLSSGGSRFHEVYGETLNIEQRIELAAELSKANCEDKTHKQRMRRNKSFYSLDRDDGIEGSALDHSTYNPEVIFAKMVDYCRLCCALNSLPEKQGRRIDAHYILGMSRAAIAKTEGVSEAAVHFSIHKGLSAMKKYLDQGLNF